MNDDMKADDSHEDPTALLTDEERAALAELADDEPEDDDESDPDAEAAAELADEDDAEGAPEQAAEADAVPDEPPAAEEPDLGPPPPAFTDADQARLAELAEAKRKAQSDFDDGDLAAAELAETMDKLASETAELALKQRLHNDYLSKQDARWDNDVQAWFKANPTVYSAIMADKQTQEALDAIVRKFTASPLSDGLSNKEMMDEAFAIFQRRFPNGITLPETKPLTPAQKADAARKTAAPKAPPTLAFLPASEMTGADDGETSALDSLAERDPLKFEAMLAKMPAEKRDAYLRA